MKLNTNFAGLMALLAVTSISLSNAILIQPYNYMLDDSPLVSQPDGSSSMSFYNDQTGSDNANGDKDIISIIGERLARLKYGRMLDNQHHGDDSSNQQSQFSPEFAELIQNEQQANKQDGSQQEQSLSSSVANMLMNVAQAAAQASAASSDENSQLNDGSSLSSSNNNNNNAEGSMSSRGSIMELDTTSSSNSGSAPSKADLKGQWFNPKETIPVLKISSMATPSKYKKVYFRSEKKLVDGAFHSPTNEQDEKKSLMKPFNSGVQRRSSRGTSSSVPPPSVLQDGVIDFLKKFRDVYIQTRPVSTASGSSASSFVSAAASSPLAAVLAPSSSSGSRPNFASALSAASNAASNMVSGASMLAAMASAPASPLSAGSGVAGATSASGAAGQARPPALTAQSYVSFWSKTFPTWVRKMLKQLRRRSLHNSSKRHQHHHQHSTSTAIGHAAQAAGAVASVVEAAGNSSGSSSSSSSSSSSHSSSSH